MYCVSNCVLFLKMAVTVTTTSNHVLITFVQRSSHLALHKSEFLALQNSVNKKLPILSSELDTIALMAPSNSTFLWFYAYIQAALRGKV